MRSIIGVIAACYPILMMLPSICSANESSQRADQLKAAYLFNFIKFVEWPPPAAATEPLTVCFLGAPGVYDALANDIEDKRVGERPLAVRRLSARGHEQNCNVLYVGAQAYDGKDTGLPGQALLTVSDAKGFARNAGIIELFNENNRLRFNINLDNAQKAGLHVSSNLLTLAATIEKGSGK